MKLKNLSHYILPREGNIQIGVSGGRSSAYQVIHTAEANGGIPNNCVLSFTNTGFELNETLDFIQQVGEYVGRQVVMLERWREDPNKVRVVNHNSASRAGEPMMNLFNEVVPRRKDGSSGLRPLPNPVQRVCTTELKIKTTDRYLTKVLGWSRPYWNVVGYRADEERRVQKRITFDKKRPSNEEGGKGLFPMYNAGVDGNEVHSFWKSMPFDLKIDSDHGNCDLCFMKSTWKIKMMMVLYPERVPRWIALEAIQRDRSNRFRLDRPSIQELWDEVQAGIMSIPENDKECGTCGL